MTSSVFILYFDATPDDSSPMTVAHRRTTHFVTSPWIT
jgi:hypothetical protein